MTRWAAMTVLAALLASSAAALEIGQVPEDVVFKDIRYLPRTLEDFGGREAHVLLFHDTDDGEALAALDALAEAHIESNVSVAALDQSPGRSILELAADGLDAEASYTILKDYDSAAARAMGIDALPAAVVLDAGHALRYRGPASGAEAALEAVLGAGSASIMRLSTSSIWILSDSA